MDKQYPIVSTNGKNRYDIDARKVLKHPTTLKIFFHCKEMDMAMSIREVQKALGIKSSSTVAWHFDKLMDGELLSKLPNNRYKLTDKARSINTLDIPVLVPTVYFSGRYIPKMVFLLSFIVSSLLIGLILIAISTSLASFYLLVSLGVVLYYHFQDYRKITEQIEDLEL